MASAPNDANHPYLTVSSVDSVHHTQTNQGVEHASQGDDGFDNDGELGNNDSTSDDSQPTNNGGPTRSLASQPGDVYFVIPVAAFLMLQVMLFAQDSYQSKAEYMASLLTGGIALASLVAFFAARFATRRTQGGIFASAQVFLGFSTIAAQEVSVILYMFRDTDNLAINILLAVFFGVTFTLCIGCIVYCRIKDRMRAD
ncbi:hypothetical protein D9756_009668 [Leucocoprinus leucothites]|uniref:Uncharacterized protein n=1 Tax=Leucocoprinus leucothites TaxID=201217 RepID=A0A8H5CUV5_9AGAR|nr:hypothetical protein D9756_009668 [Leucoagaricus leucothites]